MNIAGQDTAQNSKGNGMKLLNTSDIPGPVSKKSTRILPGVAARGGGGGGGGATWTRLSDPFEEVAGEEGEGGALSGIK